jgi:hypothetical protein
MEGITLSSSLGSSLWTGEEMTEGEIDSYRIIEDLLIYIMLGRTL